jgi:N-methylhydantoinase A
VLTSGLKTLPFYLGKALQPGQQITGPAVIAQPDTTVFMGVGDSLRVDNYLNFIIEVGRE